MKFVSSAWPELSARQVVVCKGANIFFFVFLSLCVLSRNFFFFTPAFGLKMWKQPCRRVLSFAEVLWQGKSVPDPFHLSRTYFRMKHAPALGSFFIFFVPRTHELMLPGCLPGPGGGGAAGIHQVHDITTSQSAAEMLTWWMLRWCQFSGTSGASEGNNLLPGCDESPDSNVNFYILLLWPPVC